MVVREAEVAGVRVRDVARRYGICPSLIYQWRREAGASHEGAGQSGCCRCRLPRVDAPSGAPAKPLAASPHRYGMIAIELTDGMRVRVDDGIGLAALRRAIAVLRG